MELIPTADCRLIENQRVDRSTSFGGAAAGSLEQALGDDINLSHAIARAHREITTWPDYSPTPLIRLQGLARELAVGQILYKDEGRRFGLNSFKAMGGGYAVSQIVARHVARREAINDVSSTQLLSATHEDAASEVTVTCATDGNHGRAVAWAANTFGCRSVIHMASIVSPFREEAMVALGADVVRSQGNHEAAAAECRAAARDAGWFVVSETENATEPVIAADTFAGYTMIMSEIADQLPDGMAPTHVFVQAGVGGLAATAALFCGLQWQAERPKLVVVESDQADCILRSVECGRPVTVTGELNTIMAGLAAGEVSSYAWPVLGVGADYCMAISDATAIATMRLLADCPLGDRSVVGGESGVASLAAAIAAAGNPEARRELDVTEESRILTMGTEGATDPEVYQRLVGRRAEEVAAGP
jgi:diaminopropionate ammonia-lyase